MSQKTSSFGYEMKGSHGSITLVTVSNIPKTLIEACLNSNLVKYCLINEAGKVKNILLFFVILLKLHNH